MSDYVENDYVEGDYVEGGGIVPTDAEQTPLKFFISNGTFEEVDLIANAKAGLGDNEMGLLYIPELSKIMLLSTLGEISFLGHSETIDAKIIELENRIEEISNDIVAVSVVMKAPDGTVIATPTVVRDGTTFSYQVPEIVSGAEYEVVLSVDVCDGCGV